MTTQSDPVGKSSDGDQVRPLCRQRASSGPPQAAGMLWFAGWLFTIGLSKLVWWKAIVGLVIWPYFLGVTIR